MKSTFSFLRSQALPLLAAIGAQTVALVCFDVYRVTHSLLAPLPVVIPLALFVFAHVKIMRRFRVRQKANREHIQAMIGVATAPESEGEWDIIGSYSSQGVIVPITQSEAEAIEEWMGSMPDSVARKLNEARHVAQMMQ